ncbi:MAG: 2-oxo acid dehydrogenase subunit E2 [Deltaproteobacteria bacterium]|nr:2-oxo acid dehydrogenase subunit E2 [Deltaproteobacteria bacterium]
MNVKGRWLKKSTMWRKISLNTWHTPDNATIYGLLDIDVGPLQDYLAARSEATGVKCTLTHAVTRGLALLLHRYPECNVLVRRRKIWVRDDVDIFHQVAMPLEGEKDKADLSGATIRKADTKTVDEIAKELRERALAVRKKKDGEMAKSRSMLFRIPNFLLKWIMKFIDWVSYTLNLRMPGTPRDPFGGAMVTSVGMFGIKLAFAPLVTFSRVPIIILVGQVEDRAVVRDGQVCIRPMVSLTATMDHRVLDGFQAGRMAQSMKELLEKPELLDRPDGRAESAGAA